MKRLILLIVILLCFNFASCSEVTILNSEEAKVRMEEAGYSVTLSINYGEHAQTFGVSQVTVLTAKKGDSFIQVYYFTNEEDTNSFYKKEASLLSDKVEVVKKNKYSIYRGSESAVNDFLVK